MKKMLAAASGLALALLVGCGGGGNEDPNANSVPSKSIQTTVVTADTNGLYQFFAVAFNAAPGVTYMGQLLDAANAGMSIKEIVNVFTTKDQFTSVYPLTLTDAEFATRLSANVIGLSATDQAKQNAVTDIVNALASPGWTRGDVIFAVFTNLANKSPTDTEWGGTSKQMKNQVVFARYYTEVMKGNATDVPTLQSVLAGVTSTSDTSSGIEQFITSWINNVPPVANAGISQNVATASLVTLDGSASSDANSDPLTYAWTLITKPVSSAATLSLTTSAKPTFTADLAGTYVASLTVNDGKVNSNAATVSISAIANVAPIANAGPAQTVVIGTYVILNGSGSTDANGEPLTYAWTGTRPAGSTATLAGATTSVPVFIPDVAGTYVFNLVVNDGKVNSAPSTVTITAIAAAPVASKEYNVTATRSAQNFYTLAGSTVILKTNFCYEYAYSESAVLTMTGNTGYSDGTVLFASGHSCTVSGAYSPMSLSAGNYNATLTVEDVPYYSDTIQRIIVRATDYCYQYKYYTQSTLQLTYGGVAYLSGTPIGKIFFDAYSSCDLAGIYGLAKLN